MKMRQHLAMLVVLVLGLSVNAQNLVINEFLTSNSFIIRDNYNDYDDWVEVYNPGDSPVDMGGMYITDDLNNPAKWQIPATIPIFTTVAPKSFLLIWFDDQTEQGLLHVNSKLQRDGEQIGIYDDKLQVVDTLSFGKQEKDISYGRHKDGGSEWFYFNQPTPGYSNDAATPYVGLVKATPLFSIERGFYQGIQTLSLSKSFPGGTIHYTADGSKPSLQSATYSGPLTIDRTQVIRAAIFQEGLIPGDIESHSYFIDYPIEHRQLPVLSLSSAPGNFWDLSEGLLIQDFYPDWEHEVHIEYFGANGQNQLAMSLGMSVTDIPSFASPMKPLTFTADDTYGKKNLDFRPFEALNLNSYRNISLDNASMDWGKTNLRGELAQKLCAQQMNIDLAYKQAISVHVNGEYYGLSYLSPILDERFLAALQGEDKDSLDLIWMNGAALVGNANDYNYWMNFLRNGDFSNPDSYATLEGFMDIDSYIDYLVTILYMGNNQWALENAYQWKAQNNGKWRWMLKNMDLAFDNPTDGLFDFMLSTSNAPENPEYLTLPFRKLLENPAFRSQFLQRLSDHCYLTFHPETVDGYLNTIQNDLSSEISAHILRWQSEGNSYSAPISDFNSWLNTLNAVGQFGTMRAANILNDVPGHFPEISSSHQLGIAVLDANQGDVFINGRRIPKSLWTGDYLGGIKTTLTAVARDGYKFAYWEGISLPDSASESIEIVLEEDTYISAVFEVEEGQKSDVVINEIKAADSLTGDIKDWLEIYNNGPQVADLSEWQLIAGKDYFVLPNNLLLPSGEYLLIAEDKKALQADYTGKILGNLPFGLSASGEQLSLKNKQGELMDSVYYKSALPWPAIPLDGATSIELIAPYLDNAYGHNWTNSVVAEGTPLARNSPDFLHLGKIPDQSINIGQTFNSIDLKDFLFAPYDSLSALTIEVTGNEEIQISIDQNLTVNLTYQDWSGSEWITFKVQNPRGETSADSALFFVGTLLKSNDICGKKLSKSGTPYLVSNDIDIPIGCRLEVEAGVEIRFEENTELRCAGNLYVTGSRNEPVTLKAHKNIWNGIMVDNSDSTLIRYANISQASYGKDSVWFNAAISAHRARLFIEHCRFEHNGRSIYGYDGEVWVDSCFFSSNNYGEKVNVQYSEVSVSNSLFEFTYGDNDGLDYDAVSKGKVIGNIFLGGEDDGIDIGQTDGVACNGVVISKNMISGFADKAISVGEGSQNIMIDHCIMANSYYGAGIKDSSTAYLDHVSIYRNAFGIGCFEKNIGLGGGIAQLDNSIIESCLRASTYIGENSALMVSYTLMDDLLADGQGNLKDQAYFIDPLKLDFRLDARSLAIDRASPLAPLDPDGSPSDMGAIYFDQRVSGNDIKEMSLYPNPAQGEMTLTVANPNAEKMALRIYSETGQLIDDWIFKNLSPNYNGYTVVELNVQHLRSGYYLMEISVGGTKMVSPFVVSMP